MDKQLDRIESRLDQVADNVSSINVTLAAQHQSLVDHMRRTELAEKAIELNRQELRAVEAHISRVEGIAKFLTSLVAVAGVVVAILRYLNN